MKYTTLATAYFLEQLQYDLDKLHEATEDPITKNVTSIQINKIERFKNQLQKELKKARGSD